jgi:hypothetical protein
MNNKKAIMNNEMKLYDLHQYELQLNITDGVVRIFPPAPNSHDVEDPTDRSVIYDSAKNPHKPIFEHAFSRLKEAALLLEFCRKNRPGFHNSYAVAYTFKDCPISLDFDCDIADEIYHHLRRQFDKHPSLLQVALDEPSDFVCMKMVTRLKELKRADPPKAKTGLVDIDWMREIYIAAKAAEREENK